jgi:FAD:protein FMN transferase
MGTDCHVVVVADHDLTSLAIELVEELESRWSRFRPDSDIARVNAAAGAPVSVSVDTVDAVEAALTARDRTGGRFDPTVLPALVAAGYDRSFEHVTTTTPAPPRPAGAAVHVDHARATVTVEAGAGVDLGGIGKGLAADRVADVLRAAGADGVLVGLGGDIRCVGTAPAPTPEAWGIAADHIDGLVLALAEGAVATSTTTKRRWGPQHHHVIDPRRGAPASTAVATATVVAGTAADAEVAATVALLDGAPAAATPALLVHHDGRVDATPAMHPYLR